jgi:gliding motility-associated-like protein
VVTWQQSVSPFSVWTNVLNSNDSTDISLILTKTTKYKAIVNNGVCGLDTSAIYTVNVAGNKGLLTTDMDTVCSGTNTARLELIGCKGTVTNWQSSSSLNGPWTNTLLPIPDTIFNLTGITATTYVRVLITLAAQADTSNIISVVTVNAPQTGSIMPAKNSVCSGGNDTITLSGNTGPVQSWISSTDGILWNTIPGISASQKLSTLLLTTRFAVVVTNSVCPADTTIPVVISVLPAPIKNLVVLGDSNCSGQTAMVTIENREPGVSYSLTSAGTPVSATADSSTGNYILTTSKGVTSTTLYKIIASNQAACVDTLSGTATVTILQFNPKLNGAFSVCPGDTDVLYSITKEPGHTYTINVTGDTTLKDSGITDILISWKSNVPKGTVIVSDSIIKYGCGISDTFNVTISDSTLPIIVCAKDIQVEENIADIQNNLYQYPVVSNELQPLSVKDNCGFVVLQNNFNNSDSIKVGTLIPISVAGSGNNFEKTILWTAVNAGQKEASCEVSINITINDKLQPMSAFSPNGDGVNEYWVITNIERYPDATVEVFNRWGERVFESKSNYNNDWNGSNLPVDSYHYVITQNGKMLCRGVVTIIR